MDLTCPDDSTLALHTAGGLAGSKAAEVESHIDACSNCYALMVELATRDGEPRTSDLVEPGDTFGRYVVRDVLGVGGMGTVYVAHDPELDRSVALKVLRTWDSDEDQSRRLILEARAAARLRHPNVVSVYDVGAVEGRVFLVMERVRGQALSAWLKSGPRSRDQVIDAFVAVGRGLAAAHEAQVVHRDVKPANVLVGEDGRPRLTDFGLAVEHIALSSGDATPTALERSTRAGRIVGTPLYMPPEQFRGEVVDARSDQFSFCVALYEALYGEMPFDGGTFELRRQHVCRGEVRDPPKRTTIPSALRGVLLRGLAPDRDHRHGDMTALLRALAHARRKKRRGPTFAAVALAGLAGLIGLWSSIDRRRAELPACASGTERIAGIWDPTRKQVLSDHAGTAALGAMWTRAERGFDRYALAWTKTWDDTCHAVEHSELSPGDFEAIRSCLEYRRERLKGAVDALLVADPLSSDVAVRSWAELPEAERCDLGPYLDVALPVVDDDRRAAFDTIVSDVATVTRLVDEGRAEEAIALGETTWAAAHRFDHAHLVAAAALSSGDACAQAGKTRCSRDRLSEAFFVARASMADDLALDAALKLANVETDLGETTRAQTWIDHAEALVEVARLPVGRARLSSAKARLRAGQARYAEAAKAYAAAAVEFAELLGEDHPGATGALENHATMLRSLGRAEEALAVYLETTAMHRDRFGLEHPTTLGSLNNLAGLLDELGRSEESAAMLEEALAGADATFGRDHPRTAGILTNLGLALAKVDRLEESKRHLLRALAIFEARPSAALERVETLVALGNVFALEQSWDEAEPYYERAGVVARDHLGPDHPYLEDIEINLEIIREEPS